MHSSNWRQEFNMVKPIIRWAGSKKKLVKKFSVYWDASYERYIEPFAGSACLFLHLAPKTASLNDLNSELINAYREIAINPDEVYAELQKIPVDKTNYYRVRSMDLSGCKQTFLAARFLYLNRLCFNGLYRTNRRGDFNVPFGGARSGAMPDHQRIIEFSDALQGVDLINLDFEQFIRQTVTIGDFVYLDPPYFVAEKRVFREYGNKQFGQDDLSRLLSVLEFIDQCGAKFLVSYHANDASRKLFTTWNVCEAPVARQIAGFTGSRRIETELLVSN